MTPPSSLYHLTGEEAPASPVLVVALDGWVDAGLAGATAMTSLLEAVRDAAVRGVRLRGATRQPRPPAPAQDRRRDQR